MSSEINLKLEVKGLFNQYDYLLETSNKGNPLILTGPNGYGKTTLLKILSNLKEQNILYFFLIPFNSIALYINDKLNIKIESVEVNNGEEDEGVKERILKFSTGTENKPLVVSKSALYEIIKKSPMSFYYERHYPYSGSIDTNSSHFFVQYQHESKRFLTLLTREHNNSIPLSLANLPDVFFVQANRLRESMPKIERKEDSEQEKREEIVKISENLKENLKDSLSLFLSESQRSDKEFINSILTNNEDITEKEYNIRAEKIESTFEELSQYELGDKIKMPAYNPKKSFVLKGYLDDLESNLAIYNNIRNKLNLFTDLIKTKNFAGKSIRINKSNGLRIVSNADQSFISLENLSSGEKNQLILLYDLIFRVSDNSILLIDEPELSLHVAWQIDFLDDLTKIAKLKNLLVIVATHSPQIIGERWDECYDLYEISQINCDHSVKNNE